MASACCSANVICDDGSIPAASMPYCPGAYSCTGCPGALPCCDAGGSCAACGPPPPPPPSCNPPQQQVITINSLPAQISLKNNSVACGGTGGVTGPINVTQIPYAVPHTEPANPAPVPTIFNLLDINSQIIHYYRE